MKKETLCFTVAVFGLFLAGTVFAQVNGNKPVENLKPMVVKAAKMAKCEAVENNLQKRIQTFTANKNRSVDQFEKIRVRLNNVVDALENEGYDVSILRADMVTFEGMIEEFKQNHESYMLALGESKTFVCDRSEGEFKAKLTTTRTRLREVHENSIALRTFWADTLKKDILALKGTLETSGETEVETETETETEGSL